MKKIQKKPLTIIILSILAISAISVSISTVSALSFDTYIYTAVSPNPVGVNQQVVVTSIMPNVPPPQLPEDHPRYGYWYNLTLTITKPDGTTETKTGLSTAEAGSGYTLYTPTSVGTYEFQYSFPGQTIEIGPDAGDYYKPSVSPKVSLTVQEEPIEYLPEVPLPTDYWTYPIYGENRQWSVIAGDWLGGEDYAPSADGFNPYTQAPNSAHILWTKELMFGGVMSAELGPAGGYSGRRPDEKLVPPLIIAGKLYYNNPVFYGIYGGSTTHTGFSCVDLYTGEVEWTNEGDGKYITMGQVMFHHSTSQEGVFAYLWETDGSSWTCYDAWTGEWVLDINGVQSGTNIFGPKGEILRYQLDGRNNKLTLWNSSQLMLTGMRVIGVAIDWAPSKGVYNYSEGIQWTKDIQDVPGNPSIAQLSSDLIIATVDYPITETQPQVIRQDVAYSLKPGMEGNLLWMQNHTMFDETDSGIHEMSEGIYISYAREKLQWSGYSAQYGTELWTAEPFDTAFSMFSGRSDKTVIANGVIYNTGYDGMVRALDLETGELLWSWFTGSGGLDSPYGGWALQGGYTGPRFADGKVFVINGEHTPMATPWKGGKVYAIDGETGEEVWSISGTQAEATASAVAWGCFVYLNGYDGKLYCFGKGQSELTVSAPQVAVAKGTKVLLTGTIMDQSPGQPGTPAISDESMSAWMEYLHMQQPIPGDATGVLVMLTAIDSNGQSYDVGTVTSDMAGSYGIEWTPPAEGKYQIMATFEGTESYGSSYAITYLSVGPQSVSPSVTPPPTVQPSPTVQPTGPTASPTASAPPTAEPPTEPQPTEMYIIAAVAAVVIVVAAVAAIFLRRRK